MTNNKDKVFIEILKNIQKIIITDELKEGDRLPSERELSDRLCAGRSSVREALRSLELLGLIETKRGEGTFIKNSEQNNMIEILASFILTSLVAKRDLYETSMLILINGFQLACERVKREQLIQLKNIIMEYRSSKPMDDRLRIYRDFFMALMESSHNYLLQRIWKELDEFISVTIPEGEVSQTFLNNLYTSLEKQEEKEGEQLIRKYYQPLVVIADI